MSTHAAVLITCAALIALPATGCTDRDAGRGALARATAADVAHAASGAGTTGARSLGDSVTTDVQGWDAIHDSAGDRRAQDDTVDPDGYGAALQPEPGLLPVVTGLPVHGRTGPDGAPFEVAPRAREIAGAHARRFGMRTLMIGLRTRTPDLTQYPCTACHLGRALVPAQQRATDAHQDIPTAHPAAAGGGCIMCHAAADVELLELESGERVSVDHAYRLCAQCHFAQADEWSAGAHGKRLDGWQGRRVVMGCADCHDPHQPQTDQRAPFRAPRIDPDGRRER